MPHMNIRQAAAIAFIVVIVSVLFYPSFVLGVITIRITDTGDKIGESLNIRLKDLAIHRTGAGETAGWITILNQSDVYDFVSLGNRTDTLVRSRTIAGQYDRIRFSISDATLVINGSSTRLLGVQGYSTVTLSFVVGQESAVLIDFKTNFRQTLAQRTYRGSPVGFVQS